MTWRNTHWLKATAALAAVAALGIGLSAQAQERLSLSERVQRLEQGGGGGGSGLVEDLLLRIEQLQAEMQELRGVVEQQSYELETMKRRQRDQYLDIDRRVSAVEGGGGSRPVGRPVARPATGPQSQPPSGSGTQSQGFVDSDETFTTEDGQTFALPEVRDDVDGHMASTGAGEVTTFQPETVADPAAERAAYDQAFASLRDGRYADSAREFDSFLQQYPGGEYSDNAQYWLGESYYVTRNYRIALEAFQTLINRYPNSTKVPDAMLKIGYTHYELDQWTEAGQALTAVMERFPDSTVSRLAEARLRALRLEGHLSE